jgi:hypothetical protein
MHHEMKTLPLPLPFEGIGEIIINLDPKLQEYSHVAFVFNLFNAYNNRYNKLVKRIKRELSSEEKKVLWTKVSKKWLTEIEEEVLVDLDLKSIYVAFFFLTEVPFAAFDASNFFQVFPQVRKKVSDVREANAF